jgi:hypothetical protein
MRHFMPATLKFSAWHESIEPEKHFPIPKKSPALLMSQVCPVTACGS